MISIEKIHEEVLTWFPEIKKAILSHLKKDFSIKEKAGFRDLVSEVDEDIQALIISKIEELPLQSEILGEESASHDIDLQADHLWVIDPIDGTANMIKQREDFGVLIAYFERGKVKLAYLYDVMGDKLFYAVKGQGVYLNGEPLEAPHVVPQDALIAIDSQVMKDSDFLQVINEHAFSTRYIGSSALDSSKVLEGKYGATIVPFCGPWDRAPQMLFAEELGLEMRQLDGEPSSLRGTEDYFFGCKEIFQALQERLR